MEFLHRKLWFTLVELIVVVTILAILGTIGFISYNGYLLWVRDSNRLTQLRELSDGLEMYRTKSTLFLPDKSIPIRIAGNTVSYQWFLSQDQLDLLTYTKWWRDPKDGEFFTYYLTADRKNYELLWFLEDPNTQSQWLTNSAYAADYSNRFPTTSWKKIWVILDAVTNTPVQYLTNSPVDVDSGTGSYKVVIDDKVTLQWTGWYLTSLQYIIST